ncbi:MAG: hypothetical protein IOC90_11520 [Methylocystis sp.]|nr:hypothetical protein [Methylocystis sp.]MCA3588647.1 hypothetical protein [Methylocystis sp.]MCA3592988.1 hypothetical protein [Methylocystis sp.]
MATDEIGDIIGFRRWLNARPEDTRGWESVILSVRIAARMLPMTLSGKPVLGGTSNLPRLTAASLRAVSIARALTVSPAQATELRDRIAASAQSASSAFSETDSFTPSILTYSADSAFSAANAAFYAASPVAFSTNLNSATLSADSATRCAESATRSLPSASRTTIWAAVWADCAIIEETGWESLRSRPLWLEGVERPGGFADPEVLRDALRQLPNQHVWLRWYKRLLNGTPASEEIELLYCDAAIEELWGKENGFQLATDWIAKRLEEVEGREAVELPPESALPARLALGLSIVPTPAGPLGIAADPEGETDPEQADLYGRLRRQLQRVGQDVPTQELGAVAALIDDFLDHPEGWPLVRFKKTLWVSGNQLRSILSRHDAVVNDRDPHPDKLPPACAAALRLPVETWNIVVLGDETLRQLDAKRLGPGERASEREKLQAAEPIVERATLDPAIILPEAAKSIGATVSAAKDPAAGVNGDQAVAVASATSQNVVVAVIRGAYKTAQQLSDPNSEEAKFAAKEFRGGAYKGLGDGSVKLLIGTAAVGAYAYGAVFLEFVAANATQLKIYAELALFNPQIVQMIDAMKAIRDRYLS